MLTFHGVPLLGLGVGARSYTGVLDYMVGSVKPSMSEVADYITQVNAHALKPVTGFVLDDEEIIRKRLVLDTFDLDLAELDRFGYQDKADLFEPILDAAEETGLLRRLGRRVQLTPKVFKYRDILSWMFFSDTVVQLDRDYYERLHEQNGLARKHMGTLIGISGIRTARTAS
ncbi:hypothetical protein AB0478_39240 [Streptomyces sp. NPDC051917]|uniref:hypothetical protein n=1 Tax=Streptomyces sp. NPDC051917 TaxID=3154754 RepID=UPI003456BB70